MHLALNTTTRRLLLGTRADNIQGGNNPWQMSQSLFDFVAEQQVYLYRSIHLSQFCRRRAV